MSCEFSSDEGSSGLLFLNQLYFVSIYLEGTQ